MTCSGFSPDYLGEGMSLRLCNDVALIAGMQYCFSLDVRTWQTFCSPINFNGCPGSSGLRIYAGNTPCDMAQIVWDLPMATGTWTTYNFCFTPSGNWRSISFRVKNPASSSSTLLMDNWTSTDGRFPPQPVDPCVNLPITLTHFAGTAAHDANQLNWTTASEKDNALFTVEKSTDGILFGPIGTIPGAGTSHTTLHYRFDDGSDVSGLRYYRLMQTDVDGTKKANATIAVRNTQAPPSQARFDPVTNTILIPLGDVGILNATAELVHLNGSSLVQARQEGGGIRLPAHTVPDGLYIVRTTLDAHTSAQKIIVQR